MKPLLLISSMLFGFFSYSPVVLAQQASVTAKIECRADTASVVWTVKNDEPIQTIKAVATAGSLSQKSDEKSVAPGISISGEFKTDKTSLPAGEVSFSLRRSDSGRDIITKQATYSETNCLQKTLAAVEDDQGNLPNTGPRETILLFATITGAAAILWFMTQQELVQSLRKK